MLLGESMKYRAPKATNLLSLSAMYTAFSVIFIYLSSVIPYVRLSCLFLSSLFVAALMVERDLRYSVLTYIASLVLSVLIVPSLPYLLPYMLLFGHYGIGKYYIEKIDNKLVSYLLKDLYFTVFLTVCYFAAGGILFTGILSGIDYWIILLISQIVFPVYDYLMSLLLDMYYRNIRKSIIR